MVDQSILYVLINFSGAAPLSMYRIRTSAAAPLSLQAALLFGKAPEQTGKTGIFMINYVHVLTRAMIVVSER